LKENLVFNLNRIYTGLIVLTLILIVFFFKLDFFLYLFIVFCFFYEIYKSGLLKLRSVLLLFALYVLTLLISYYLYNLSIYLIILALISFLISLLFPKKINYSFSIFLVFLSLIIFNLFLIDRYLVYLVIMVSFYNDTLAFIFGNLFKGPLIAANISPNKTWSGTALSFLLTLILLIILHYNILLGVIISVSLFLGDLYFSFVKRKIGMKDFSNILHSHGGILDRVDSMSFFFIILLFVNL